MGWLGWTEDQALAADVNAIEVAMRGKVTMLRAIYGAADENEPAVLPEATAGMFSRAR